jgi:hypothetical protein
MYNKDKKRKMNERQINKLYTEYKKNRKLLNIKLLEPLSSISNAKIAIIVPHRDRLHYLKLFITFFKKAQNILGNIMDIYIIDQDNNDLFNRGLLLNIGYSIAKKKRYDRYIFHDIDSFPDEDVLLLYTQYLNKNIHFSSPDLGYKYTFPEFCGGVIGMSSKDFEKINGFPNDFWGWGGEDDALYNRLVKNKVRLYRPTKGSYEFDQSITPHSNKNPNKKYNILTDLTHSDRNGIRQLKSLEIYIEEVPISLFIKEGKENKHKILLKDFLLIKKIKDTKKPFNIYIYKIDYK